MARITVAKLFETVAEVDQRSQVALMQSEDSIKISEKNRIDLEKLIATLRTDFTDIEQTQEIIRSDKEEDNTIKSSFSELKKSFDGLVGTVDILRTDLDSLYEAFYTSQIVRQNLLKQEEAELFKAEDDLQKNRGLEKEGKGVLSNMIKDGKDPNQIAQERKKEEKSLIQGIAQTLGLGALAGGAMGLGRLFDGDDEKPTRTPNILNSEFDTDAVYIPDVSNDTEFIEEVKILAKETGTKPSELMALYNAESGIRTNKINPDTGATGIFQLLFDLENPEKKEFGYTREQFKNLSRAEQVRVHRKYLKQNTRFFSGGHSGIEAVNTANFAPAYLGEDSDTVLYSGDSEAYKKNKNIDEIYGNNDGNITIGEYSYFITRTGGAGGFTQYDEGGPGRSNVKIGEEVPFFLPDAQQEIIDRSVEEQQINIQQSTPQQPVFDADKFIPPPGSPLREYYESDEYQQYQLERYGITPGTWPPKPSESSSSITPAPATQSTATESLRPPEGSAITRVSLPPNIINGGQSSGNEKMGKPRTSSVALSNTKNGAPVAAMIETKYLV